MITRADAENRLDNVDLIDEGMYTGYDVNQINELIDLIYDSIDKEKCSNCLHYGLGQCLLYHDCELIGGECGKGFIEIDNPDEHYCADYEDRIK